MNSGGAAFKGLRTALAIWGIGLLVASCGGSSDNGGPNVGGPPDDGSGSMVTDLGDWNTLEPGSLDISDTNEVLRAYYDDSGAGHIMASAPVQPQGMGSATWTGMWSGRVDVNPAPYADIGLGYIGLTRGELAAMGGDAHITAYFENDGVEAQVTYEDTGLDGMGLGSITSDRVAVIDGQFEPRSSHSETLTVQGRGPQPVEIQMTGDFTGEGAFGGTDAEGVAGYLDGDVTFNYLGSEQDLGLFRSVFYGTKDSN